MREAILNPIQQDVLARLRECGAELEFVFLDMNGAEERIESETTHRDAVITAMYEVQGRYHFVTVNESKAALLKGVQISRAQFLGTNFDLASDRILLGYSYPPLVFSDERGQPRIASHGSSWARFDGVGSGYAYAFAETPHGLGIANPEEVAAFFSEVNQVLLGGIRPDSIIFEWPTDWSNYFDAGHEWWGSFLWSFANPGTPHIIVIAASTTD